MNAAMNHRPAKLARFLLGQDTRIVVRTEAFLPQNDPDVLSLFAGNPFAAKPPLEVRVVLWQYWFTDSPTRRHRGLVAEKTYWPLRPCA